MKYRLKKSRKELLINLIAGAAMFAMVSSLIYMIGKTWLHCIEAGIM